MSADQENEPSIEEILDSIRQIISDEDDEQSEDAAPAEQPAEPEPEVAVEEAPVVDDAEPEAEDMPMSESEEISFDAIEDEVELEPAEDAESEKNVEEQVDDFASVLDDLDQAGDDDGAEDDIIELTNIVEETEEDPMPEPEMDEPAEEFDPVDAFLASEPEPVHVPEPEPEPEETPSAAMEISDTIEGVLSQSAESAALSAFGELARKSAVDRAGLVSVEDVVREEIRPILRNWVDDHLPKMLERLLREELEKVAKRAMEEL